MAIDIAQIPLPTLRRGPCHGSTQIVRSQNALKNRLIGNYSCFGDGVSFYRVSCHGICVASTASESERSDLTPVIRLELEKKRKPLIDFDPTFADSDEEVLTGKIGKRLKS